MNGSQLMMKKKNQLIFLIIYNEGTALITKIDMKVDKIALKIQIIIMKKQIILLMFKLSSLRKIKNFSCVFPEKKNYYN